MRWRPVQQAQPAAEQSQPASSAGPSHAGHAAPHAAPGGLRAQLYETQDQLRTQAAELEAARRGEHEQRLLAQDLERHNQGLQLHIDAMSR